MKDLRAIIAQNIQKLRTESGLTQLELAQVLNYSDKAVSKWERAEAVPDVTVLKRLADYFSVSVDYLLEEEHRIGLSEITLKKMRAKNHLIISLVSIFGVFSLATVVFSLMTIADVGFTPWLVFLYAAVAASVVGLVFNCVWGIKRVNLLIVSALIWFALVSVYLTLLLCAGLNLWIMFIIGIPAQAILLILSGMRSPDHGKESKTNGKSEYAAPSAEEAE